MDGLIMSPAPGERLLRFVGDRVRFSLRLPPALAKGARALLRTNLGKADRLRQEVIATHAGKNPFSIAFWRDVPLQPLPTGEWAVEMPLTDVGFYRAKAYMVTAEGRQVWPDGPDAGVSVHPSDYRTANMIYCAFPRMFGESKSARATQDAALEKQLQKWDARGYTVIPPSGKIRDLIGELPHIFDTLGCRILQLLPVNPVPTTLARFGRFGSPYACLDSTAIDPALVEFDRRTTGIGQFCELTDAVHRRGGRVLLDMVINHTGWGSALFENHPEWFVRRADGSFASPGAWGVTWEDLVQLCPDAVALWEEAARDFLTWCRRGVDGFRCDAGYKVPVRVWQYIEARVRQEFPQTVFLLEGLGGPWEATESLLTEGGMQWAYSELFQNFGGPSVARYLDYSHRQSARLGLYVNYSETHDNERLAAGGRVWSLMRNRLCALTSVSGGFGFTNGVEWLAEERINVHSSRGMSWGNPDNLLAGLAQLNHLLAGHPCFFDGAVLTRLSQDDSPVYALRRDSAEGLDQVLALVNMDERQSRSLALDAGKCAGLGPLQYDLLGQKPPEGKTAGAKIIFDLEPGAAFCLASTPQPRGLAGEDYRRARAQSAWAIAALSKVLLPEEIGPCDWRALAARVHASPRDFLAALPHIDRVKARADLCGALDEAKGKFPQVVEWSLIDVRRVTPVPPGHWLLLHDSRRFRATLECGGWQRHVEAIEVRDGFAACFAPQPAGSAGDAELDLERHGLTTERVKAAVRFLAATPAITAVLAKPPASSLVLLTNGRGGMARLCVDLGKINSKYDCALGANLHPDFPVDRHVLVKRIRVWVSADGFITALNLQNLASFQTGPPAAWNFVADAGDGRTVEIQLTADMLENWNTTLFTFARRPGTRPADLPPQFDVRLTVRADIEDRNFHSETHRNGGAEFHFTQHCRELRDQPGFAFTPAPDRQLRVFSNAGVYHPQPEWCQGIPHPVEQSRGQVPDGDAYSPGWFDLPLTQGKSVSVVLSADIPPPALELMAASSAARQAADALALRQARFPEDDAFGRQLTLASRAYVVRRGAGRTLIAGYPWFLDWGRDTLIGARGLLAAGMVSEVEDLLVTFGRFSSGGLMPNTIHGEDASDRDTSDAPLWYGVACEEAAQRNKNIYDRTAGPNGRAIADVLAEIGNGYARGTANGIRMDPASALIWSPPHFTWMDTNFPACTPREGYPVEIQVLWIRLLRQIERLGAKPAGEPWGVLADRAEESLKKFFWLEEPGYLADLLIAKPGQSAAAAVPDNALRSNYLPAIAFGFVTGTPARRAVEAALRFLFVPGALRTLAPLPVWPPLEIRLPDGRLLGEPREPYQGRYEGDEDSRRKPAYHNGTAWVWTLPAACEALARAWDSSPAAVAAAKAYLAGMDRLMMGGCLGQLPEILDGDAPHQPRGCDAQAWSVLEALRVWKWLNSI
ncbi:MAG: amylo-alpha-1,6-glucosidase [Verrucomicrobiota bacterium]|jgi:glycogen debranching enzyme/glycosidase